ncbi:bleomycin resistance family protein [Chryseobacterium lactis]|uniref:Bleomycin resistance family protein n=1 Tax=Chryseobacterium lactis TaxID=1241981 RepID=A0A3G6RNT3_CHRLC|nr:VOC family protein [Chryseobacterium lactis]AZA84289.1 bleomycin resistance family protein [Chryseobacterium lactis]AZB04677.1 bleomycin resistance family protein [Chryseobacterium lactis]PNW14408.1 bleomycin resistance family protein [Chryseobacterium lactis]
MKFAGLRPMLWTKNMDETLGFYMHILGFELISRNDDWQWASIRKDEVYIMISQPNEEEDLSKIGFSGSFYFNVNQVDELWGDLKSKARICYEIETFEWEMREFAIYDNNGYILQFGEPVDNIGNTE